MNARNLAAMIESYLEADGASNGSNGSSIATALTDSDTRQQLRQLMQTTNQLKQDVVSAHKEIASLKSNLQMSMMLPLLMNQDLTVVSDTAALPAQINAGDTITFKSGDMLSALLPAMMFSGPGDSGGSGMDNPAMMAVLALALSKPSDARLKTAIVRMGTLAFGVGLYRFRYLWSPVEYVGVMAQEVIEVKPHSVAIGTDGYYRVDYAALGIRMVPYSVWKRTPGNSVEARMAA
jgi:hypothetical protein